MSIPDEVKRTLRYGLATLAEDLAVCEANGETVEAEWRGVKDTQAWLDAQDAPAGVVQIADALWRLVEIAEDQTDFVPEAVRVRDWLENKRTRTMQPELKSCPFCGSDSTRVYAWNRNDLRVETPDTWTPECCDCGCQLKNYLSEDDAIAAWNRRAQPQNEWTPVRVGQWQCQCDVCRNEEPDSWHWDFYVNDNGATFGIVDREDEYDFWEVTLPPGLRLWERRVEAEGD